TAPARAAAPKGASTPSRSQTVAQRALANTGVQIGLVGLASAALIAGGAVLLTVRRRAD
ncbi:MAG TPA: LPXTG cell wall anchor domain-containing protein, partial [Actinomycetales bacterium]|nr:LPXTG cell wall anchor domain-containing protein [Actinomycetales bacterium]